MSLGALGFERRPVLALGLGSSCRPGFESSESDLAPAPIAQRAIVGAQRQESVGICNMLCLFFVPFGLEGSWARRMVRRISSWTPNLDADGSSVLGPSTCRGAHLHTPSAPAFARRAC